MIESKNGPYNAACLCFSGMRVCVFVSVPVCFSKIKQAAVQFAVLVDSGCIPLRHLTDTIIIFTVCFTE